ncbi:hypothetical protein [Paenarthrobacter nitroguajacolicus]|uniref:hypothetical protein n=1 Tax=Paenarthrobacter nitroguajacolicus TaxID=211146 RepID=UPI0015B7A8C4|nr:hypothetical protein [Paenarthrobacter nitroguajacolicus]NWL34256.1 hypothetical protein [Paenarthrobacter nitroguajacolicus]
MRAFATVMAVLAVTGGTTCIFANGALNLVGGLLLLTIGAGGLSAAWTTHAGERRASKVPEDTSS